MLRKFSNFVERYKKLIPVLLFFLFLAVSLPGVNWGVPALWNPDELIWRVDQALSGELQFDETEPDFNYPSLPKYVMFGIGKIVYGLGYSRSAFFVSARIFSALLGASGVVLVYYITLLVGGRPFTAGLAGLFCIASGVIPANSRFAHNDIYLMFFSILCLFFSIKYHLTKSRLWIYASFIAVGMAASSKYTGGSLFLLPVFVLSILNFSELKKDWLKALEIFFIGSILSFLGFAAGTPKSLLSMTYYFEHVVPALQKLPQYSFDSGNPIGLYGQWGAFRETVGMFLFFLFTFAVIWFLAKLIYDQMNRKRIWAENAQIQVVIIIFAYLLFFDLPFLFSIHYLPRHFIPFVPSLSILSALFVGEIIDLAGNKGWNLVLISVTILLVVGISYSMLNLVSIALLFINDARIPASEYIATIPGYKNLVEYTLYPPIVNKKQFYGAARNYPIYFVKYPDDVVPTGGRFEYNQGEQGLIDRDVDFFVIDSFTYSRLYTDSICQTNLVECHFFKKLLAGQVTTFRLVKQFTYSLPPWLPDVTVSTVNPEIRIYERVR